MAITEQGIIELAAIAARARTTEPQLFISEAQDGFWEGLSLSISVKTQSSGPPRCESNFSFSFVLALLARLEACKGKHYEASFIKRGRASLKANIDRKYDRLDVVMRENFVSDAGETPVETLGDLAVYALKGLIFFSEMHPEQFAKWVDYIRSLS